MITALVTFRLPNPITREQAKAAFTASAPHYQKVPGLIRKYYLLAEDGIAAGGVYLWESQEAAEQLYTEEWKKYIAGKYGTEPNITYFDTPIVVDNLTDQIISIRNE